MGSCFSNPKPAEARASPHTAHALPPNTATKTVGPQNSPTSTGLQAIPDGSFGMTCKATSAGPQTAKNPAKARAASGSGSQSDTDKISLHPTKGSISQGLYRFPLTGLRDGLSSTGVKRLRELDALDFTGLIYERTKPKSYGGFSYVSQGKLNNRLVSASLA